MLFLRDRVSRLRFWDEIEDIYSYRGVIRHRKGCISSCHSAAKCLPRDSGPVIGCALCARLCAGHCRHTDPHRQGRQGQAGCTVKLCGKLGRMPPDNSSLCTARPSVGLPDRVIPERLLDQDEKATRGPETGFWAALFPPCLTLAGKAAGRLLRLHGFPAW